MALSAALYRHLYRRSAAAAVGWRAPAARRRTERPGLQPQPHSGRGCTAPEGGGGVNRAEQVREGRGCAAPQGGIAGRAWSVKMTKRVRCACLCTGNASMASGSLRYARVASGSQCYRNRRPTWGGVPGEGTHDMRTAAMLIPGWYTSSASSAAPAAAAPASVAPSTLLRPAAGVDRASTPQPLASAVTAMDPSSAEAKIRSPASAPAWGCRLAL